MALAPADDLRVAENVLLYQRDTGSWPKNHDRELALTETQRWAALNDRSENDSMIDNGTANIVMRWSTILTCSMFCHLVCSCVALAPADDADWQTHIKPNAAYLRAQQRPPFRMSDPVGLVTDESEKNRQREAAEQLRASVAAAQKRGDREFTIPPGQYRFADNRGFALNSAEELTMIGEDVTFWFERPASALAADPKGLELNGCRNVTIRGLAIDFDPPVFLQAKILEIDEQEPGYVIEIDPSFPDAEMDGGSYFLYRADGRWIRHGYLFYRHSKRIEGRKHKVLLSDARVLEVHNRHEVNLQLTDGACRIIPGDYIVLPWRRGKGISMYRCENCVLEDVDEYASPGMGILEYQGQGGNVYRRVRIMPPPGTRRLHACAADGFHNAQTDRGPQLIECEFTGTSDDFLNLHGHFGVVWHKLDAHRYVIGQANLGDLRPGETLTFYDDKTVESQGTAHVSQIEPVKDARLIERCNSVSLPTHAIRNYYEISLDRELSLSVGDLVALDRFRSAGFLIKDCYFHDAMARTLINGAGSGTITGNVIERSAWGLVIHFETWQYFEGPMPRDIQITGNVFREVRDLLLPQHATAMSVTMIPTNGGYLRTSRPLRSVSITGNYVERPGGFGIVLTNTRGATIADNTIVEPMYRPALADGDLQSIQFHIGHPNYFEGKARKAAISLWSCSDVEVRDNRIVDPEGYCEHGPVQVGDHCDHIRVGAVVLERENP